jgi:nucleotide-binding universal stress UspA family protein
MITRVYVTLDGSERARTAIAPATRLARACDAPLTLLSARWPDAEVDDVRTCLDEEAAQIDGPASTWVILDRAAAPAIALASAEPGALVVMATRGRGAIRVAALGSVADEVVRTARGPIVLVGPHVDPHWTVPHDGSVLVGVDGSLDARHAAEAAANLARSVGATVELYELMEPRDADHADVERKLATSRLRAAAEELRAGGVATSFELGDGFDAADVLLERLRTGRQFMLAVGSHGRSGLERAAFGSVTLRVVHDAHCPVLVTGPRWRTG